jgi:hypothetical protein
MGFVSPSPAAPPARVRPKTSACPETPRPTRPEDPSIRGAAFRPGPKTASSRDAADLLGDPKAPPPPGEGWWFPRCRLPAGAAPPATEVTWVPAPLLPTPRCRVQLRLPSASVRPVRPVDRRSGRPCGGVAFQPLVSSRRLRRSVPFRPSGSSRRRSDPTRADLVHWSCPCCPVRPSDLGFPPSPVGSTGSGPFSGPPRSRPCRLSTTRPFTTSGFASRCPGLRLPPSHRGDVGSSPAAPDTEVSSPAPAPQCVRPVHPSRRPPKRPSVG